MAVFKIDASNYRTFIKVKFFKLDKDFIADNKIAPGDDILIEKISDDQCTLYIENVDFITNKITVHTCVLKDFYAIDSKFGDITLWNLTVGSVPAEGFVNYLIVIENTTANNFWVFNSTFNQGILFRKECFLEDLRITDSQLYHNFAIANSACVKLTIESSKASYLNFKDSPPFRGEVYKASNIGTINIFSTEIIGGIELYDMTFDAVHFHRIRLKKTEKLQDYQNRISITYKEEQELIKSIKVTESEIEPLFIASFDGLTEFIADKTRFGDFRVNCMAIDKFVMNECNVSGYAYWGMFNHLKIFKEYLLINTLFEGEYNFSVGIIEERIKISGCKFARHPSFFSKIGFAEGCVFDFSFTKLGNFIFESINFQDFSFKDVDIAGLEFRNCQWREEKSLFFSRTLVNDERPDITGVAELIKLKDIYAKLKTNFSNNSDYISNGKFLISEHETKRKIARANKSWVEYMVLTAHRNISSYGESFTQPIVLIVMLWLILSVVYMFTGFTSGNRIERFTLSFDCENLGNTAVGFFKSAILSLKNLVPFPISTNFFVYSSKEQPVTQTIELLQKIVNLILFASFTTALLKHINK